MKTPTSARGKLVYDIEKQVFGDDINGIRRQSHFTRVKSINYGGANINYFNHNL